MIWSNRRVGGTGRDYVAPGPAISTSADVPREPPGEFTRPSSLLRSMPEMPDAREHHGDAVLVGRLDDLVVAH